MRSDQIKKGVERAPNRSLLYALGYTEEELNRPLVGVVSSWNEIVPGHMDLDKIVEAVKAGIRAAGGTPVTFPAIAVCDGIAMGHVGMKYSLVTRDLIADSTEAMVTAHQFDGLVMVPNCDKNVPGLLMAAARLNIPTIFCSGGPMLAGRLGDGRRTCLSHMFEAVGAYHAGTLDEAGVREYEENACPSCGSCSGMYTANSMNCLTEAIGLALPGNGTILASHSYRKDLFKRAAEQVVKIAKQYYDDDDCMKQLARLVDIYTMLAPYTKTLVAENAAKGTPVMRPLFLQYEDDPRSYTEQFEYLYGPDLLVAPVWQSGKTEWEVYLPSDEWTHLWTGEHYAKGTHTVPAELGDTPVFCRKGSQWAELFDSIRAKYGK